jgi:hypothetical protein
MTGELVERGPVPDAARISAVLGSEQARGACPLLS